MQLAKVIGRATSTVKHATMQGWKLLIVQPLGVQDKADGEPVLAIDNLGTGRGDRVMISSDGKYVREIMASNNTPVRWVVIGIQD